MAKSLEQYAAENPQAAPPEVQEMAAEQNKVRERQENVEAAQQIMQQILEALKSGEPADIVLYMALKCIGLFAADAEFTSEAQNELAAVYENAAQQSMLVSEKEAAAENLANKKHEYLLKLHKDIERQAKRCSHIEYELNTLLRDIETDINPE